MAEIKLNEDGRFEVTLNQAELNTIALLLGHSSDGFVAERAEDWEIENFSQRGKLDGLYNVFHHHSDME